MPDNSSLIIHHSSFTMKPNIILILVDDLGWSDLGCYGSSFYETPSIDRLCASGMRFSDAYAAAPVCSPTRASLLSGRYPAGVGVTDWIDWGVGVHPLRGKLIDAPYVDHLPLADTGLAQLLKAAGYQTWHVGKWHLGAAPYDPLGHGFDVNIAGNAWGLPANGYWSPWGLQNLEDGIGGEYLTDRLTDEAVRLIGASDGRPFFLNLWHYAVHTPIQAKPDTIGKYEAKAAGLGLDRQPAFADGAPFPTEHKRHLRIRRRLQQSDAGYAAMIEHLDQSVGRVLDAVAAIGQAERTLVVFSSDNGGLATAEGSPTSNLPLREGKGWIYEGGIRVPLIAAWPGAIAPMSVCSHPVTSPDLYATLVDAAGIQAHSDGQSLLPLLRGGEAPDRDAIYWHYPHYGNQGGTPASAIRAGDYKLIEFWEDRKLELYNLRNDIGETHDLAALYPTMVDRLHRRLDRWRAAVQAKVPQPNPYF